MNMPLQIECTLFVQENLYDYETLEKIALRLGKQPEEIEPTINYLTSLSILEINGDGEKVSYRYVPPACYRIDQNHC